MAPDIKNTLSNQIAGIDQLCGELENLVKNEYGELKNTSKNYEIMDNYVFLMAKLMKLFETMDQFICHVQKSENSVHPRTHGNGPAKRAEIVLPSAPEKPEYNGMHI